MKFVLEKGFASRSKWLRVVTLGGEIKEMDTVIFDFKIKDLRGNFYKFQAHGLDDVTWQRPNGETVSGNSWRLQDVWRVYGG